MPSSCVLNAFYSAAQRVRYQNAMKRRFSCRAFSEPLDISHLSALSYAAERVCLPGTRIVVDACPEKLFFGLPVVGRIHGMSHCAYMIAEQGMERMATSAGVSGEAFILEATAMGVGTCWVAGSYRRGAVNVDLQPGERLLAVTPLGLPENPDEMPPRRRKNLSQIGLTEPSSWPLWAYHAAESVRIAPSAVNLQPWRLHYAGHALQLMTNGKTDTLDMGIALLHMEAAMEGRKHLWKWGEGKTVAHLIVEENE